ncbi:MAG: metallophosphoesterase family protein [Bacteroidota bacterium]
MRRRKFIQKVGVGTSAFSVLPGLTSGRSKENIPEFNYPYPRSLADAKNDEGLVAIRLAFSGDGVVRKNLTGKIRIKNGNLIRSKATHFESSDKYHEDKHTFYVLPNNGNQDILTLWLDEISEETTINAGSGIKFRAGDLLVNPEITGNVDNLNWSANLLFYHEIGEINPKNVGIEVDSDDFNFVAMADPQGGDPFADSTTLMTRMRIHNAFLEESVALANKINCDPRFTIVIGDITDGQGKKEDFEQMNVFLKKVRGPLLYSIGNHETTYRVALGPGYNMDGFSNFFAAQKAVNGLENLLYSFNIGQWHFVVWPDPLRAHFFETHPHYFDWLEKDLEKHKDRPTMFFQHVPIHPIGINPMISYTEDVGTKKEVLNILRKYGNVKYVLSGHVHIPIKSSFKTAIEIDGIKFINLPAAGYRPRSFGEEDYNGGPSQGIAIVEIKGKEADITFKSVTLEEYQYPPAFPKLDLELYSLEFQEKWELPAVSQFVNGSFEDGIKGWGKRWLYQEDENPSNICEVVDLPDSGNRGLYMFTRIRGYNKPGQDRWPQNINRAYQAIAVFPNDNPQISFRYKVDLDQTNLNSLCGAYVLIEGYSGTTKFLNNMYSLGKAWYHTDGYDADPRIVIDLGNENDGWHDATINIATDYFKYAKGKSYSDLKLDRLVITLGTWSANDGHLKSYGIFFDAFSYESRGSVLSNVDGKTIELIPDDEQWYRRTQHMAGDHWYIQDNPTKFT